MKLRMRTCKFYPTYHLQWLVSDANERPILLYERFLADGRLLLSSLGFRLFHATCVFREIVWNARLMDGIIAK